MLRYFSTRYGACLNDEGDLLKVSDVIEYLDFCLNDEAWTDNRVRKLLKNLKEGK